MAMTAINEWVPRIFLDTEVFIRGNFDYKSPQFKSLMTQASTGRIKVFLTDLTLREIKANIRSRVNEAVKEIKPKAVLRNSGQPHVKALFDKLDGTPIQEELVEQLKKYLKAAKVTILAVPPTVLSLVVDAYFKKQPPFGPGKNKAEFPDALVLETLREWCAKNELDMAVVSLDKGVKAACAEDDALHQFDDILKYLDALFASNKEALSSFVRQMILATAHGPIFEKAKEEFPRCGAILVDQDGEVDEISLTDVEFYQDPEEDVVIISLDQDRAEVELAVSMTFRAELSYTDSSTGTWDSEDRVMVSQDEIKTTVEQYMEGTIGVEVGFKSLDRQSFEVKRVWFDDTQDIDVYANHDGVF